MLEEVFIEVYEKFKLNLYKHMFLDIQDGGSTLSPTETFTVEVINALKNPKVSQLTGFLEMSQPNIAYKISSLIKKGYVEKIQSKEDKREYFLKVTDKFYDYYNKKNEYTHTVISRLSDILDSDTLNKLESALKLMSDELMSEVTRFIADNKIQ